MNKVSQKQLEVNRQNAKLSEVKIQKDKALVKKIKDIKLKWTPEDAKKYVKEAAKIRTDPERILEKLAEQLSLSEGPVWNPAPEFREALNNALMVYGLDTHEPLTHIVDKRYRPLVVEFGRQIIQEYNCQMPSEKALAQIAVGAYARIIEYSYHLNICMKQEWPVNDRFNYFALLSKEIDLAERHFITALMALKQLKSPSVELSIKAKTAYVSQNQQINDINNLNVQKDENIEPK